MILYCIKCESMEKPEIGIVFGHEKIVAIDDYPFKEIEFCEFPLGFAFCDPPETAELLLPFETWLDWIGKYEPDEMEMERINQDNPLEYY